MEAQQSGSHPCAVQPGAHSSQAKLHVPTESIASPPQSAAAAAACAGCGAALAEDQRYCLQCGERIAPPSSVLIGGVPSSTAGAAPSMQTARVPPGYSPPRTAGGQDSGERRGNAVTIIAGVGVLLLAMGVGVLIGRSGSSKSNAPVTPVINVATAPASATAPAAAEAAFASDWPQGTSGYTVELQALPSATTQLSAVEAAKNAASAKGAKSVGALKSDEFSGLPAGDFIVYSGVYKKQAEASKAAKGLQKSFSGVKVIHIASAGGSKASAAGSGAAATPAGKSGVGASESHPAPPSVIENLRKHKGKSYEEESKNLPNVVSTG